MAMPDMYWGNYPSLARGLVFKYVRNTLDPTDHVIDWFTLSNVYIIDSAFLLDNFKCTISTSIADGMIYRVTYNQREDIWYLDAYKRFNQAIYRFDENGKIKTTNRN